ncbi:MAG TPA: DUF885 family protein, partial [Gemmatimonadaceae bacterium]|nr:DUF885 family protein [Gemmatimonadaceae bacterium]
AARAFAGLTAWLRERPAADQARHACGPELLELLVRRGHWCDRGPAELLREARARLTDAEARLDAMSRYAGRGGLPEVQERLAADHPAPEAYLDAFHRIWEECRAAAVAADLVTWPEAPIRYRFIPEATREAAPHLYYLFYRSPAPFDRAPVHDYVVTPLDPSAPLDAQQAVLRANSHATIKLNHVVHHGALGHHVQNAHAYAGASLVGRVAAVDAASRITMFAGGSLAEGWACYATDLMEEVGFLTMLERVSEQHTRVRLLARAVVDLSLHTGALSMDEAAALFRDRARMPDPAARAEVAKASMFPGTAMMYWLGTQGIHDLRAARSLSGGAGSTLRRFHDTLLSYGAVPVPLIARLMREAP